MSNGPLGVAPRTESALAESYRFCRRICRSSGSSFYPSFALLDKPRRDAMFALYAFARITDDLGDAPNPCQERRAALLAWREQLRMRAADEEPVPVASVGGTRQPVFSAIWPALKNSIDRFEIPCVLLERLVEGVLLDVDHQPPRDWNDLLHYCNLVASSVGLACTHIWKIGSDIPVSSAVDCGVAFQLTNILRDAAEDARVGRIYAPATMLEQFHVSSQRWLDGAPDGDWRGLIDALADRAIELYQTGWETRHGLTPRSQRMFSLIWHNYRSLLHEVVSRKETLWSEPKSRLSLMQKGRLLLSHVVTPTPLWPVQP